MASSSCFYPRTGNASSLHSLPPQAQETAPIYDNLSLQEPLLPFDQVANDQNYGIQDVDCLGFPSTQHDESYLYPTLTSNERLRLTTYWYHTRGLFSDQATLSKIQEKLDVMVTLTGWEFAICGLVDSDIFIRMVTVGIPLAILPRRESTCSHTILQESKTHLYIPDLASDERFRKSPAVAKGGLKAYAGAQLRFRVDEDQEVPLGSLCIASNTAHQPLSPTHLRIMTQFADMVVGDVTNATQRRREKQQLEYDRALLKMATLPFVDQSDTAVLAMMRQFSFEVLIQSPKQNQVQLRPGGPVVQLSDGAGPHIVWEDDDAINEYIAMRNHDGSKLTPHPIRAIITKVKHESEDKVLIAHTNDMTWVFDDIDVRFILGCASSLNTIAQEKRLREALQIKIEYARGMTHRLRTPIHGILGAADLLESDDPATVREAIHMIKDSGRELMLTVNNVIRYNHLTEPMRYTTPAHIIVMDDLERDILNNISWSIPESRLGNTSILFDRNIDPNIGFVVADSMLVQDCLQSLVINAIQHTSKGSIVVTISAEDTSVAFDIRDTGDGIPAEDHHRIFQPYQKGDEGKSGAGLGLTLAHKTARTMNGHLSLVSSAPGEGSHFRIQFDNAIFVCPPRKKQPASVNDCLPKHYFLKRPGCILEQSFARFLQSKGLQQSEEARDSLAVLAFENEQEFDINLATMSECAVVVSLVTKSAHTLALQAKHPEVHFFSGPFFTSHLESVLAGVNEACKARPTQDSLSTTTTLLSRTSISSQPNMLEACSRVPQSTAFNCLLVDDNAINLRILAGFCGKLQLPHVSTLSGLNAIEEFKTAASSTPFHLILLDLQMPRCSGIDVCQAIRAFEVAEGLPRVLIFIVTGQDCLSDRQAAREAGADEYYVKPLTFQGLKAAIARYSLYSP